MSGCANNVHNLENWKLKMDIFDCLPVFIRKEAVLYMTNNVVNLLETKAGFAVY